MDSQEHQEKEKNKTSGVAAQVSKVDTPDLNTPFVDNRPEAAIQRKLVGIINNNHPIQRQQRDQKNKKNALAKSEHTVQGVFLNRNNGTLHVLQDYADIRVPWDDVNKYSEDRDSLATDPNVFTLLTGGDQATVKNYLQKGFDSTVINNIVTNDDWEDVLTRDNVTINEHPSIRNFLESAYLATTQLVSYGNWEQLNVFSDLDHKYIPRPKDAIPEAPDLAAGVIEDAKVCTLIALFKTEGAARIRAVLGLGVGGAGIREVVQDMHDHFMAQIPPIQYDDTSEHVALLGRFGYQIAYAGPTDFYHLHYSFKLQTGRDYILDIEGHTVKVRLLQDIPDRVTLNAGNIDQYYRPDSEDWNFAPNAAHFTRQILYVYEN